MKNNTKWEEEIIKNVFKEKADNTKEEKEFIIKGLFLVIFFSLGLFFGLKVNPLP